MSLTSLHTQHPRRFEENRFVYPVLSRRSEGISIGVNLNPDKVCNFDCIYCQVDRTTQSETRFVEMEQLAGGAGRDAASWWRAASCSSIRKFRDTPPQFRRLNDIAFSGDGEPTTYRNFDEIIAACAELKRRLGLDEVKMVLITNASMFHRPHVAAGAGDSRPEQRRNLGQARSGHRRVFQARRSHADSVSADSGQHHGRRAGAAAGDSGAVHAGQRRAAERTRNWTRFATG